MNIQYLSIFSFSIALAGICTVSIVKRFLSIIISIQLVIISAIVNFYCYSLFLYNLSGWDKIFVFFAVIVLYMLLFLAVFYNYLKQTGIYEIDSLSNLNLFMCTKSDWWGEDKD